jgi:hypothetical protein
MKGLVPQPVGWTDSGNVRAVTADAPLPVQLCGSPGLRFTYSGTVPYNSSVTLHGGAAGTPTVRNAVGYRRVYVYLQHRMQSAAQTGNVFRVRRRATASDGTPYTTWTPYADVSFDSGTTDATRWFSVVLDTDTAPPADELELTLGNSSATSGNGLVFQAVVLLLP